MTPGARVCLVAPSVAATHAVAGALAAVSRAGDTIVLAGEMGAGKTAFAQGFGHALGVTEPITSPTFTLVHSYAAVSGGAGSGGRQVSLHHADVYRLEQLAEVVDLAFGELAEFDGIVLVEWGDVVAGSLGEHAQVRLDLTDDEDSRRITVTAGGSTWAPRWANLEQRLLALDLGPCED